MKSESRRGPAKSIEGKILELFRQACSEQEFEAAEHLLQALEALAAKSVATDLARQSCVEEAYLAIAEAPRGEVQRTDRESIKTRH